jgi:hypothetical protein
MEFTRRHFANLLQAGAAMAAVGFPVPGIASERSETPDKNGALFNRQRFAPLAGSTFRVASKPGEYSLVKLLAVEDVTVPADATPEIECSLLRFWSEDAGLGEGTHLLVHKTAGEFRLFMTQTRSGQLLAYLAHVPADYLAIISIPRRAVRSAV